MKKSVPEIQAILNEGGLGREPLAVAMVKGFELLSERIEAGGPAPVTATQGTRLLVIGAYVVPVVVLALVALIVGPALRSRDAQLNDAVAAVQGAASDLRKATALQVQSAGSVLQGNTDTQALTAKQLSALVDNLNAASKTLEKAIAEQKALAPTVPAGSQHP